MLIISCKENVKWLKYIYLKSKTSTAFFRIIRWSEHFFFIYNVSTISLFQLDSQQSKTQCQIDKQRGFSQIYFDLKRTNKITMEEKTLTKQILTHKKVEVSRMNKKVLLRQLFTQKWNLQRITYKKQRIKQKELAIARNVWKKVRAAHTGKVEIG